LRLAISHDTNTIIRLPSRSINHFERNLGTVEIGAHPLAICVDAGGGHPAPGLSFHLRLSVNALRMRPFNHNSTMEIISMSHRNTLTEAGKNACEPSSQWSTTTRLDAQYAWGKTTKSVVSSLLLCLSWGVMSCLADPPDGRNAESFAGDNAVMSLHFTISVALGPGQPATYTISGELFATEDELVAGTTVQLLVAGATYTHDYWDFGTVEGRRYSYARTSPHAASQRSP
jgi:hypothetical protein